MPPLVLYITPPIYTPYVAPPPLPPLYTPIHPPLYIGYDGIHKIFLGNFLIMDGLLWSFSQNFSGKFSVLKITKWFFQKIFLGNFLVLKKE